MAKTSMEVLNKRIHTLQDLWTSTRLFKKIWNLQNLLP